MIVERTEVFEKWFSELKDDRAKTKINARIDRIERYDFFWRLQTGWQQGF